MSIGQFCPVEEVLVIFKCFGREMRTIEWIKSFHPKCWICNFQHIENFCQLDYQIYNFVFKFHDLAHLVVNFVWGFGGSTYWVPFTIITKVLFVLVCHCQLRFWIYFFSCGDEHWKEILHVYKHKKFKQINHFYSVFGICFSNSVSSCSI